MEEKKQNQKNNIPADESSQRRTGINSYIKYAGMGFQMLAVIGVCAWAGVKLDQRTGNDKNLYTAILSLLGVIVAIYTVIKDFIHKDDQS